MHFEMLAARTGIALPSSFIRLQADGRTRYGDNLEDWKSNWLEYSLKAQPLLSCAYDLEWIDPAQADEIVEGWLNPRFQDGRRFLPFAISGAGDAYCLMPSADGGVGVGMIWHDRDDSAIESATFEHFLFAALVESAADFEHLLEDFSPAQARECVLSNIRVAAAYLPMELNLALAESIPQDPPGDEGATGMISRALVDATLSVLPAFEPTRFPVLPRWRCSEG
ncbi:SMI1/KNR4 family protein [Lysobacter sp. Root604]|uniref:SMI1/KNR4 family protein n=1 Tax=Lysobacter sp. Root604 TaxID=1736568 RepID=UPI0006F97E90|nr:SMI1/KNR4 family protein [Lysobacter sp. Root604]KRA20918.1 hypothetical protein ASD69_06370 [Lysobacter sp. Root604]